MKKMNYNRPRRREPYHYYAEGEVYVACIMSALQHGQSIPVEILRIVYQLLAPYMNS